MGDAALGVINSSQWNKDIDNAANKAFVAGFQKTYKRLPSLYASQGYDAARLIGGALKSTGGKVSDKDAFRAALLKADFESVRGNFKFGPNHHPIQDGPCPSGGARGQGADQQDRRQGFLEPRGRLCRPVQDVATCH